MTYQKTGNDGKKQGERFLEIDYVGCEQWVELIILCTCSYYSINLVVILSHISDLVSLI